MPASIVAEAASPATLVVAVPPRRRPRNRELAMGASILLTVAVLALAAPLLSGHDPRSIEIGERLMPWSRAHPLGTDMLGHDLFARTLHGGRVSLLIGGACALLSVVIGTVVGVAAAASRIGDAIIMRVLDGVMSVPAVLLAIALTAIVGGSVGNVIVAVTVVEAPRVARLARGVLLSLRERPYVEAAVAAGSGRLRLFVRHLLPGLAGPLAVQATFVWSAAMLIEAALSFIGAGVPPSTPSWGNMIAESKSMWQVRPALIFVPAAALSLTILGVNMVADGLRRSLDGAR